MVCRALETMPLNAMSRSTAGVLGTKACRGFWEAFPLYLSRPTRYGIDEHPTL